MSPAIDTPYLTLEEAAYYLRLDSEEWLRERAEGVGTKLGRRWVFRKDRLDSWYDALCEQGEDSGCRSIDGRGAGSGTSASGERSIGHLARLHDLRPSR